MENLQPIACIAPLEAPLRHTPAIARVSVKPQLTEKHHQYTWSPLGLVCHHVPEAQSVALPKRGFAKTQRCFQTHILTYHVIERTPSTECWSTPVPATRMQNLKLTRPLSEDRTPRL